MLRDLNIGMTGDDVRVLQILLNHHLGGQQEKLVADGIFGPKTKAHVIEFQRLNRLYPVCMPFTNDVPPDARKPLQVDGIVGQHTLLVLLDTRELNIGRDTRACPQLGDSGAAKFSIRRGSADLELTDATLWHAR
jgi:hypothetical protein